MGRYAEDAGYGEVWVAEDYFFLGGIASAGLVLQATNNVKVGIGVLSSVVRHPAVTAMEIATLANAHPGRLLPAIGHGVPAWTKQMGLYPGSPLGTFREVITSIRRLLNGEVLSEGEGHYYFDGVGLTHPVAGVPLLGGVVGPKSLELSGEVADGTVMSMLAGAKYVEFAKSCALMGARRAGRSEDHLLPTFSIFSVDEDGARAKEAVRDVVAFYLAAVGPTALTGCYDANDQLADMVGRGGAEIIAKEMPDEWLDAFAVAGDPSECAAKIDALRAAGATSVVLVPTPSTEGTRLVGEAAQSVLPLLGR
jgi:alkanesulfonate monooxygenase SsuD/methylene tetrahydromethanopterin reductase-like flavin-dependent oxidoreductase (luciferase family)